MSMFGYKNLCGLYPRIERLERRMMWYSYEVIYVAGKFLTLFICFPEVQSVIFRE